MKQQDIRRPGWRIKRGRVMEQQRHIEARTEDEARSCDGTAGIYGDKAFRSAEAVG